ncbi:hypothetical protein C8K38_101347 [Rhodococcus sp. OK611]|uniref:hypothetical protein n=1 Tax=unclassified Rhodococcus (in: high G+C Gram-positive bacteria) TaxID=192944 RepID=UPI000BDD1E7D|nr:MULTISPECIES: hypothetical protein [unclassified Rhodococcus (in: high G+C Gram-positive bacteria)]PTR45618.1 hypothetical protein C8K38_101347 [Rhodococcus sp. OK611]SNX89168.1 hypothetical protein SAMN05447004_101347 [Rhodococcus sp. OK270]
MPVLRGRALGHIDAWYGDEDDIRAALAASVSPQRIEDALAVCLAFNITDCLANAFDFSVASPEAMNAGARHLVKHGYR